MAVKMNDRANQLIHPLLGRQRIIPTKLMHFLEARRARLEA